MAYRNYNLWLIVRIILMLINVFLTGSSYILIPQRDLLFLPIILTLILALQAVDLIFYLQRMSRELARFVNNLSQQDLSEKFDQKSAGPPFRSLYSSLNKVVSELEEMKVEKEAQFSYMQVLLGYIPTAIVSLREDGRIVLLNDSARELLKIQDNSSWEEVEKLHPELTSEINRIKGRGNRLVGDLSVNKSTVRILGTRYTLITLQDIRTEIEQKEIEAWHRLIQILRHEIRNSVTPIASMSETILMLVEDQAGNAKKPMDLKEKDILDIHGSIRTVHSRSERLYQFVEKYRQLTRVPPPEKQKIVVADFLDGIVQLFSREATERGIDIQRAQIDANMSLEADPSLIEQVTINLVKNSIHALENTEKGYIRLLALETKRNLFIKVEDNGKGIEPSELQDIFLPFYSTKEDGMGIGLSLSRQIMNLHGGTLKVESNLKTVFSLVFQK
jgi:nitrogen fixation/metabolism regulation signal transduction histidine kinase